MSAYISAIGTAVPEHKVAQEDLASFMIRHLDLSEEAEKKVRLLYRASGIRHRHSVVGDFSRSPQEFDFFPKTKDLEPFPSVGKRMNLYKQEAIGLCEQAAKDCLGDLDKSSITHLITVSCTGMYAPGLDIELIERLNLSTDVQRTSINFMGCYAAFNAIKVAEQICSNNREHKVLIVAVELCSIHLLKKTDDDTLLSNALFGDGAASVLVEGARNDMVQLELSGFYADLALSGKEEMAWHINDFAFEMKLSAEVPQVIQEGIGDLTKKLLSRLQLNLKDVDYYAIHPGGKRILEVIEKQLGMSRSDNEPAYEILRNYGNMSSPTVLFVLKYLLNRFQHSDKGKSILSFAFGPGLTLESMLLKIS